MKNNKLPVFETIYMALAYVLWRWRRLVVALLPTLCVLLVTDLLQLYLSEAGHGTIASILAWSAFPVAVLLMTTVHRIMILGPDGTGKYGVLEWGYREWRFLIYIFAFTIGVWALLAGWWKIISLLKNDETFGFSTLLSVWVVYIAAALVYARICLVLPATAVDSKLSIRESWKLTYRNTWRVAVVIYSIPVTGMLIVLTLTNSTPEATIDKMGSAVDIAGVLFGFVLYVIEISCLSFAYVFLSRNQNTRILESRE